MPSPASQTRVRPRSVACHGGVASRCGPCMLPAICAGSWWWTKVSPPSASSAAATTYSCSAVRGAVGACVAAGWRGCGFAAGDVGQQLRRPPRHGTHGDGRDRGRQPRAVRLFVLPEPRGISGEVPAGRRPGHRSAVRAVRFGTTVASPFAVPWWRCRAGGPAAAPPGPAPARGRAGLAAGSSARLGTLGACGTGFAGGALGPPVVGRGVGVGTSGLARRTGCGALATVPPRLPGALPRRGAANPGGPGGWTCPRVGCRSAGKAPAAAPAPGLAPRG